MNRETSRSVRNSYSSQILNRGKENTAKTTNVGRTTSSRIAPTTTKPTLATRGTTNPATSRTTPQAELPSNDDWKQKMSQMESVVGMLSTQVMTLTEHFSSTKNSIEQAAKDIQNAAQQPRVIQVHQAPQQLPTQLPVEESESASEEQVEEEEVIVIEEPAEVIVQEKIVYETEEVLVSEEEPEEPEIDITIFTEEIAKLNASLQEQLKTNARTSATQKANIEMLNHKIELTQSSINSAQSSLQSLQLENAQTNAAVIDLDFQRKKIEAEIKFTTERLQEELKTTREQLINQIKTTTEEFNLEFETKKTKIRRLKEQSNSKLKKNQELDQILSGHQFVNKALFEKVSEAEENRRKMCDSIQELKGNIRILCRLSPASDLSKAQLEYEIPMDDPTELTLVNGNQKNAFKFDRVFAPSSHQNDVFAEVFYLIESSVKSWKNACLFSYGQSGSGKSYTLLGSEKEVGILQRSIDYLLSTIASFAQVDKKSDYSIYLGAMCVLNETLYDQFDNDEIQIKYTKNGLLDFSLNLEKITTINDFNDCIHDINLNKKINQDDNFHSIYQIVIKRKTANISDEQRSVITFVDLNKSEKHQSSEDISLVNLGTVIGALTNKQQVPFKNAKLTEILKDCIGGSTKTTMIAHITPYCDDVKTTMNTLQFVTKVGSCDIDNKSVPKKQNK